MSNATTFEILGLTKKEYLKCLRKVTKTVNKYINKPENEVLLEELANFTQREIMLLATTTIQNIAKSAKVNDKTNRKPS